MWVRIGDSVSAPLYSRTGGVASISNDPYQLVCLSLVGLRPAYTNLGACSSGSFSKLFSTRALKTSQVGKPYLGLSVPGFRLFFFQSFLGLVKAGGGFC